MSGSESENDDLSGLEASSLNSSVKITPKNLSKASSPTEIVPDEPKPDESREEDNEQVHKITFVYKTDIEKRQEITLPINTTVKVIKAELAKVLNLQERNVKLFKDGRKLHKQQVITGRPAYRIRSDLTSVMTIDVQPDGEEIFIETGLDDSESDDQIEDASVESISEVKIMSTQVLDPRSDKEVALEVAVLKLKDARQFYGGYRNKKTGVVYYHATSQTDAKNTITFASRVPAVKLYSRETQTLLPLINEGVNTLSDKCVQVLDKGVYIPGITDKIVTAKKYQPFDEKYKRMTPEAAALILQKAWKFFIKKKRLQQHYKAQADAKAAKEQFKGSNLAEFHKQQISLLTKDSYPTTRSAFYDLYTVLGEWKAKQVQRLKENKSGFAYKVAVADLQQKETQGLLEIEEQRIRALKENLKRQDIMFMEGTARSRVRQYTKGNVTIIDDLNIQKAREFKELFASYIRTQVTKAERIEILASVKGFLTGFEAVDMTGDMIELLDREVDLITMGIEEKHLTILRKRFESLFINLARNPEFNPQAKYFRASNATTKNYGKIRCISCHKVMFPQHMFIHLRMSRFRTCTSCSYMHTTATAKTNLAPYKRILDSLRTAEQDKCCRSAIPYLLQPMGMCFLVSVLWDGKSVISGSSYLPGLRVTRWLPTEEWSMWNTILLTELEAHKHERLVNPLAHYGEEFVLNVMNRNILGRIHFRSVADIDAKFRQREPRGVLPKDHLLLTNKRAERFLPKNDPHSCLTPGQVNFGSHPQTRKRNACN